MISFSLTHTYTCRSEYNGFPLKKKLFNSSESMEIRRYLLTFGQYRRMTKHIELILLLIKRKLSITQSDKDTIFGLMAFYRRKSITEIN